MFLVFAVPSFSSDLKKNELYLKVCLSRWFSTMALWQLGVLQEPSGDAATPAPPWQGCSIPCASVFRGHIGAEKWLQQKGIAACIKQASVPLLLQLFLVPLQHASSKQRHARQFYFMKQHLSPGRTVLYTSIFRRNSRGGLERAVTKMEYVM